MGKAIKRLNTKVVQAVDRRYLKLMAEELPKVLERMPDPWEENKLGRPGHKPKVTAGMLFLKGSFDHTYNSAESELCNNQLVEKALGTNSLPGHSVLHRGMKKLPASWIALLNRLLIFRFRRKGTVIIDSTCFVTVNSSDWYDIRIKRNNEKKIFLKLHIVVCEKFGLILSYRITAGNANDSPYLRKLLKEVLFLIVIGDKAYANRLNLEFVIKRNGSLIAPPKSNSTTKSKGCLQWRKLVNFFKGVIASLLYHTRSFIEGINSSIKKRTGSALRAIKRSIQKKEVALKVVSYNMRRKLYIETAEKLGESLWIYP